MIDHFGRKFVMTIGILLTSLGFLLIPFISTSLFPGYYIGKSIFSSGIIALQMLPLAADYVHNSTKGIMTGFTFGIGFIGGGIAAVFVKGLLYIGFAYHTIYWILSGTIFILGFILRIGLKGGNQYYKIEKVEDEQQETEREGQTKWQEVRKAIRTIPWIPIAWMFGVLGNSDLYIMTTGLVIWIKSLIPADEDPTMLATSYQGLFFVLSFIVTAILALKVDKVSHMKIIFPILFFSTCGFTALPFVRNPRGVVMYVFFALEGLTLPGILVYSSYLSARYNPPKIRGTISGISNSISFVGAMIILSLGGILHDHWRKDASFIIYWILLFTTLLLVSLIYLTRIRGFRRKTQRNFTDIEAVKFKNEDHNAKATDFEI